MFARGRTREGQGTQRGRKKRGMMLDSQDKVSRRCCSRGGRGSRKGRTKQGILQEREMQALAPMHGREVVAVAAVCGYVVFQCGDLKLAGTHKYPCAAKDGL